MKFPQPLKLLSFWSVMSGDGRQFSIFLILSLCVPEIVCSYLSISLLNCKAPHLNLSMRSHFWVQTTESYPVSPQPSETSHSFWATVLGSDCPGGGHVQVARSLPHSVNHIYLAGVHSTLMVFLPAFWKRSITQASRPGGYVNQLAKKIWNLRDD